MMFANFRRKDHVGERVMMRRAASATALCLMLAACATPKPPEPIVRVQEVRVPVRVPCKPPVPPVPSYADEAVSLDAGIFDLVRALLVSREQRKAEVAELRGAIAKCE